MGRAMTDLPVLSPATLLERLDRAHAAAPHGLVALDADGTLWSGDAGVDTFEAALAANALRPAALPRLQREATTYGLPLAADATTQARIVYDAVHGGVVPEDHGFAMMAWAFAGYRAEELDAFVDSVLARNGLDARLHRELAPVLAWAEARGVPCWVVSASPRFVIRAAVARLGVPATRVVAMTPLVDGGGVALPELRTPLVYGPGKVAALVEAAGDAAILAAFGDSAFDAAMLARATVAIAVRPKPALVALAPELPALATLAPV